MLMKLMLNAMGDYGYAADIAIFTQKRGQSGAAAPQMVRMRGRRFVTMSEPDEGEPLASALLKFLTGCDKITVRDLYAGSKQMIEFEIMCKFFLSCNEKPPVRTVDGGTWRRIKVVDFPNKFVHEPKLPNEHPIDESIMENLMNRRSRPINVYRKLAYQALEQIGYTKEDVKLNWSQYAGCSCPCSPGFIATFSDRRMLAQTDLWVQI
jgi:phage/plasmid-associated DNA primase